MAFLFVAVCGNGRILPYHSVTEDYGDAAAQALLAQKIVDDHVGDGMMAVDFGILDTSSAPEFANVKIDPITIENGIVTITSALDGLVRRLTKVIDQKTRWLILEGFEHPDALTVENGGSGHAVDDVLTFQGGVAVTAATARVTSVNGSGVITEVEIIERGEYTSFPPNPISVNSSGTGTGGALNAMTDGKCAVGPVFSLAQNAQTNWTNAMLNKDFTEYPVHFPSKDDTYFARLDNASDVLKYYAKGFSTKRDLLSEGAILKGTVAAAPNEASAQAVFDSDTRTSPNGTLPPF